MVVIPCVVAAGIIAAYLLHVYADRRHCPWYVLLLVWTTWSLGLVFFLVLPFDVSTTFHQRCEAGVHHPGGGDASGVLVNVTAPSGEGNASTPGAAAGAEDVSGACPVPPWGLTVNVADFWNAVYWTSMLLGYFMSDFLRDVIASGAFTVAGRVRNSLRNGALFYVPFCLVGLAFIGYQLAAGSVTLEGLRAYCKAAANAFSLCVVVLMLGYGLVELPRYLWNKGNIEGQLRYVLWRVSEYKEALAASAEELGEALALLDRAARMAEAAECVGDPVALQRMCEVVSAHVDAEERAAVEGETAAAAGRMRAQPPRGTPLEGLVSVSDVEGINYRVKTALLGFRRNHANFERAMTHAIAQMKLSELAQAMDEASWNAQRSAHHGAGAGGRLSPAHPVLGSPWDRRYLRVVVAPQLWRGLGAACGVLSILVVVCESTIIFRDIVNLSIVSWVLFLDPAGGPTFLVAFAVPLLYNTACVYFAFFRMKLFNFYALHTGQNSDYGSLLFNGTYMCRLAPALAYNYLNLLHEPHRGDETGIASGYIRGLGDMNVVPFLGADYYNDYAPFIIVILCGCTYLNLFQHLGNLCGARQFQFDDEDHDAEMSGDGARLVEEERRRRRERGEAASDGGRDSEAGSCGRMAGSSASRRDVETAALSPTPIRAVPGTGAVAGSGKWRRSQWPPAGSSSGTQAMPPAAQASLHAQGMRTPYTQLGVQRGGAVDYGAESGEPELGPSDPTEQELAALNQLTGSMRGLSKFDDI